MRKLRIRAKIIGTPGAQPPGMAMTKTEAIQMIANRRQVTTCRMDGPPESDSTQHPGPSHPRDRQHERGGSQADALAVGHVEDLFETLDHPALLLALDLLERPSEMLEVLDPLEVADDHAPGVGQDVGDDGDLPALEDLVALGPGGAVGGLDD